jgi:uncharacterized membrane protein YkvI
VIVLIFKRLLLILQVGATYIGTVVGAGFASGQEIVQFFTMFGSKGLLGIILTGLLFCWLGMKILLISHRINAVSYQDLIRYICGARLGSAFNLFIAIFLLGGLCVMLAGTGSICFFYLMLPYNLGVMATAILSGLIVLYGIRAIMLANSIVVPLLTLIAFSVSYKSLLHHGFPQDLLLIAVNQHAFTSSWLLSALVYTAYNMTLALTLLAPMGGAIKDRQALVWGGMIGGAGLGILAFMLVLVTLTHYPAAILEEIPMLFITKDQVPYIAVSYIIVLWAEMLTTAIASLYGLAQTVNRWTGINFHCVVLVSVGIAVIGSQWGFGQLISLLYPLFGFVSFVFLATLALAKK